MKRYLPLFIGISATLIVAFAFLLHSKNVSAASAHIVISQVQVSGTTANDEFVELYNPTSNPVDLTGWRLRRESSSGGSPSNLVSAMSGIIPAHGYFLIAFPAAYTGSANPDLVYSATSSAIAANNTILLYSDAGITLVDKVGMGTALDNETSPALGPDADGSIQRKLDDTNGHGQDTDNNSVDFEVLLASTPRNSSVLAPTPSVAPTDSPTLTPSPTPTTSPTATPTVTPTLAPSATPSPTNTPSPTPTMTPMPTATPTMTPSPTVTMAPTSTPTVSPTTAPASPTPTMIPSPTPTKGGKVIAYGPLFTCTVNYRTWNIFGRTHYFPYINCARTSN